MAPKRPHDPSNVDRYLRRCRAIVESHGHMVQSVGGTSSTPDYSYTIGRTRRGAPELILIGLRADVATHLLNELARRLDQDAIADDVDIPRVAQVPLRLRSLEANPTLLEHMRLVVLVLEQRPVGVRQVLWPDEAGHFPGSPTYSHAVTQDISQLSR